MSDQGDWSRVEPSMPEGTNAGLVSASGLPYHADSGGRSGLKGRAAGVMDTGKSKLAGRLHDLGDRIEHTGRDLASKGTMARPVGRVLDRTGSAIEGSADYLRTHDIEVIGDDFVASIRKHPLASASIAIGVGWLLGRVFGGGSEEEQDRPEPVRSERRDRDEEARSHVESDRGSPMMDRLKGRVSEVVASGIAAVAARRIRERIAGR